MCEVILAVSQQSHDLDSSLYALDPVHLISSVWSSNVQVVSFKYVCVSTLPPFIVQTKLYIFLRKINLAPPLHVMVVMLRFYQWAKRGPVAMETVMNEKRAGNRKKTVRRNGPLPWRQAEWLRKKGPTFFFFLILAPQSEHGAKCKYSSRAKNKSDKINGATE